MDKQKNAGWLLLIIGIAAIGWTLYSSYNVFSGKKQVPQIFKLSQIQNVQEPPPAANGQLTQEQVQNLINDQIKNLIPSDAVTKILNLSAWAILAFIFIFGGTQIAGIGIKILNKGQ